MPVESQKELNWWRLSGVLNQLSSATTWPLGRSYECACCNKLLVVREGNVHSY